MTRVIPSSAKDLVLTPWSRSLRCVIHEPVSEPLLHAGQRIIGMEAANFFDMRHLKLTGREATIVRTIGFTQSMLGAELQDFSRMESEDLTDSLNGLIAAGFVQTIPYAEQIDLAEMPVTAFEINPAFTHELRLAIVRR